MVRPFRQQKVGHRCTRLRVILQPDLSLLTPRLIILCLQEDGAGSVDHRLLAAAQSAIHIPAEKLCRAFFLKLSAGLFAHLRVHPSVLQSFAPVPIISNVFAYGLTGRCLSMHPSANHADHRF